MGSERAALMAGQIPKNSPTPVETTMPRTMAHHSIEDGSPVRAEAPVAMAMARTTPTIPPTIESVADSTRNWRRISTRRAPVAFRIPISRVRSVTETSMMFMTTMPPTRSDIDAMATVTAKKVRLMLAHSSKKVSFVEIAKSSSSP